MEHELIIECLTRKHGLDWVSEKEKGKTSVSTIHYSIHTHKQCAIGYGNSDMFFQNFSQNLYSKENQKYYTEL